MEDHVLGVGDSRPPVPPLTHAVAAQEVRLKLGRIAARANRVLNLLGVACEERIDWQNVSDELAIISDLAFHGRVRADVQADTQAAGDKAHTPPFPLPSTEPTITDPFLPPPEGGAS